MRLTIHLPEGCKAEREYILSVIMHDFLGLDYDTVFWDKNYVQISSNDGKELLLDDSFFQNSADHWLSAESLPDQPLKQWNSSSVVADFNLVSPSIPVIYGVDTDDANIISMENKRINLGIDILGSAFFMLSRYEEAIVPARDQHDRFPAHMSVAYQEGFLTRPIVNEYVEIFWVCLKYLWPGLERRSRQFNMYVSHDVDWPFQFMFSPLSFLVKRIGADIIRRHNPLLAIESLRLWMSSRSSRGENDPYNTFGDLMEIDERHGLASTYYFITDHPAGKIDGIYNLQHSVIKELLKMIYDHGHEIGLHTSYNSYLDAAQTRKEFLLLQETCMKEGIQQSIWGVRQHYLRWNTPTTLRNLAHAAVDYDSTLSYADHAGYRCGTCYEYPTYDLVDRKPLSLRERPLIAMDCSVIDDIYMGQGSGSDGFDVFKNLKDTCRKYDGDYTLLWHNTRVINPDEKALYEAVIKA